MKKIISLFLSLVLVFGFAACGAQPEPAPTPEPTEEVVHTPEPTPEPTEEPMSVAQIAEKLVSLMAKQDFNAVWTYGSSTLRNITDANAISSMWYSVVGSLGEFEGINSEMTVTGKYMEYDSAAVFCEFALGGVGVALLLNAAGELDSILMNYYTPQDLYSFTGDGSATPLFWEVTSPEGGKMYMFGSYHLASPDFYPLPDEIMSAYNESDALAVEYDTFISSFDVERLLEMQNAVLYADGSTAASHLSELTHELAVELLSEKGVYSETIESYKLSQWNSLILQVACMELGMDGTYGVDSVLLSNAHQSDKKVLEIESQASQLELLNSTSDLYNDASIRATVREYEEGKEYLVELFEAYASGDLAKLEELLLDDSVDEADLSEYTAEERAAIISEGEAYARRMMAERNYGMADKAEEYIASGDTVFFVVGLAHMLGEEGLVALLTDAGYTVEQIVY